MTTFIPAYAGEYLKTGKNIPAMLSTSGNVTETHGGASMFNILSQKRSGIYCYENLINGRKYVGQSIDIDRRKAEHERNFRNNKKDSPELLADVIKYGRKNFKFSIILLFLYQPLF